MRKPYQPKPGECQACGKRPVYCRCNGRTNSMKIKPVDPDFAKRIFAKLAAVAALALILGCSGPKFADVQLRVVPNSLPKPQASVAMGAATLAPTAPPALLQPSLIGPTLTAKPYGDYLNSVRLEWTHSISPEVIGYNIYFGPKSGNPTNSVSVGYVTNATLTGLVAGARYYFYATAENAAGGQSPSSNEVSTDIPTGVRISIRVYAFAVDMALAAGRTNTIQSAPSPVGPWTAEKSFLGTNGTYSLIVTNNRTEKFYRVKID